MITLSPITNKAPSLISRAAGPGLGCPHIAHFKPAGLTKPRVCVSMQTSMTRLALGHPGLRALPATRCSSPRRGPLRPLAALGGPSSQRVLPLIGDLAAENVSPGAACPMPVRLQPSAAAGGADTDAPLSPARPPAPLQALVQRFESFAGRGAMVGLVVATSFELLLAPVEGSSAGLFGAWSTPAAPEQFAALAAFLVALAATAAALTFRQRRSAELLEPVITSLTSKSRRWAGGPGGLVQPRRAGVGGAIELGQLSEQRPELWAPSLHELAASVHQLSRCARRRAPWPRPTAPAMHAPPAAAALAAWRGRMWTRLWTTSWTLSLTRPCCRSTSWTWMTNLLLSEDLRLGI